MKNNLSCPCKKKSCPRHGDCEACRKHHEESKYKRPVYCDKKLSLRKFRNGDEFAVSDVICTTLSVSNRKDYPPEFIEENIAGKLSAVIATAYSAFTDWVSIMLLIESL